MKLKAIIHIIIMKKKTIYFIVDNCQSFLKYRALNFKKLLNKSKYKSYIIYFNKYQKSFIKLLKIVKKNSLIYLIDIGNKKFWFSLLCKIFLKNNIIFDTGDDYYLLNKEKGKKGLKLLKLYCIQNLLLKFSDIIITRGYYHKKYLEKKGFKNVYQIPDCVDLNHSKLRNTTRLRNKYRLKNFLIVGLIGTLNWNQKYNICYGYNLIESLNILKKLKIKAIIIGDGAGLKYLKQKSKEYGIENKIIFTGKIPYLMVPDYLSLINIGVSTQSNNSVGWFRTTGKLPEYLALNKYIIATNIGEAKRVLKNVGSLLPYKGIKDEKYPLRLANEIKKIYYNREKLKKAQSGRKIAKIFFNYEIQTTNLEKILNQFK